MAPAFVAAAFPGVTATRIASASLLLEQSVSPRESRSFNSIPKKQVFSSQLKSSFIADSRRLFVVNQKAAILLPPFTCVAQLDAGQEQLARELNVAPSASHFDTRIDCWCLDGAEELDVLDAAQALHRSPLAQTIVNFAVGDFLKRQAPEFEVPCSFDSRVDCYGYADLEDEAGIPWKAPEEHVPCFSHFDSRVDSWCLDGDDWDALYDSVTPVAPAPEPWVPCSSHFDTRIDCWALDGEESDC